MSTYLKPVVVTNVVEQSGRVFFDCEITNTKGRYGFTCYATDGAIFAKKQNSTAQAVRVGDFRIPFSGRKLLPAIERFCSQHLAPAADTVEAVYFAAARRIELIADANPYKGFSEDEIYNQRGETAAVAYELAITDDGQPGAAERKGLWQHIREVVARTDRINPNNIGLRAVTNEGLAEIQLVLMEAAETAKQFGAVQAGLFA